MGLTHLFRTSDGLRFHGGAVVYAVLAYCTGWIGLFQDSWLVNIVATVILAHGMVIGAYMIHECGHNLVFQRVRHNTMLGRSLSWMCGSAYGTYEDIRYKHFRHHVDNDDVVWFDYERWFADHPRLLKIARGMEWFYLPAHDLLMHVIMIFTSFIIPSRRSQRLRNVLVILVRGGLYFLLLIVFPAVAILYAVAYLMMITVLRFMDSLQHDYPYSLTLVEFDKPLRKGDFLWEQEHTFSNPHTLRADWPNWLTLNFGFHNAHHEDMTIPWYRLPEKHREMYGDDSSVVIPLRAQLEIFHRQRVHRITGNHGSNQPEGKAFLRAARRAEVYGGNAASFLTSF